MAEAARTRNDGAKAIASALERNPVVENLFVLGNKRFYDDDDDALPQHLAAQANASARPRGFL